MIVCCPRSVLIPCWDPIMGAQRTLFPGQLSTAVLVRRKPLSFLGKHTLRCTAILLEQRKFYVLVFKTYFESEFNNQCIGIWWPVHINHSFLCRMHSLYLYLWTFYSPPWNCAEPMATLPKVPTETLMTLNYVSSSANIVLRWIIVRY